MQGYLDSNKHNCLVLLGPTASGKTGLAVNLAYKYSLEIISADSRQVYKGLDLGTGKDLNEYEFYVQDSSDSSKKKLVKIPYHLIDITTLDEEYNVYKFQTAFYDLFNKFKLENKTPFIAGGTGMYVDSVVRGYDFVPVEENLELRKELEYKSLEELDSILLKLKPNLHNKSDLLLRDRVIRAIEIETFMQSKECEELRKKLSVRPDIKPFIIGTALNREQLRKNIRIRLEARLSEGMCEEVKRLHDEGYSWERLEKLGLEYRFISFYLENKISYEDMVEQLYHQICQFAKRQVTWFRGMEKKGVKIHWLPDTTDKNELLETASVLIANEY